MYYCENHSVDNFMHCLLCATFWSGNTYIFDHAVPKTLQCFLIFAICIVATLLMVG